MYYSAKRGLAIACRLSVRLSVCDVGGYDHIGWKSWKVIALTISPVSSLFVAEKFWGENVRSTPTSITSGWIESTESHVILGRGVALWLFVYFCLRIARSSLRIAFLSLIRPLDGYKATTCVSGHRDLLTLLSHKSVYWCVWNVVEFSYHFTRNLLFSVQMK